MEINGDISGLRAPWVYVWNTRTFSSRPFDSAAVDHGHFDLRLRSDSDITPFTVHLSYGDAKNRGTELDVVNPYKPDNAQNSEYSFLLENGGITLHGDLDKRPEVHIIAGAQNEFYFRHKDLAEIDLSSSARQARVFEIDQLFQKNPDAWYGMQILNKLRYQLDNEELANLFNKFTARVKAGYDGKKVREFLNFRLGRGSHAPNPKLQGANGAQISLLDTGSKLNLLVFWASWCSPCRQEIPALKRIYARFSHHQLRIVSVSIDRDSADWKNALAIEKMPWEQLRILPAQQPRLTAQYNLGGIPQIFLITSDGRVIKNFFGFDPANESMLVQYISPLMNN